LDCEIIYIPLIIEHNSDVSPENYKQCSNCTVQVCHGPGSTQSSSMHFSHY